MCIRDRRWLPRLAGSAATAAALCLLVFGVYLQPAVTQVLDGKRRPSGGMVRLGTGARPSIFAQQLSLIHIFCSSRSTGHAQGDDSQQAFQHHGTIADLQHIPVSYTHLGMQMP